ncbi:MAG: hypothetical protein JJU00_19135 [Opitutales bacterium]|nr:hypothetical protein [Opitutales bacterium]
MQPENEHDQEPLSLRNVVAIALILLALVLFAVGGPGCATTPEPPPPPVDSPDVRAIKREYMEMRSMLWTDECAEFYAAHYADR